MNPVAVSDRRSSAVGSLQEDTHFLQCYICLQKVKKARMCPHCSKLACHECLRTWVQERRSECPHCRRPVQLSNFADCQRFIDDLINVFKKIDKMERPKQVCEEHSLQMQYYCSDCSKPICSDCGMFGSSHKNHAIIRLSKVYEQRKTRILAEMTRFDRKIDEYKRNGMDINLAMQKLSITMHQKKGQLETYFANVLEKLELEYKQKTSTVLSKFQSNQQEIELLESLKETIVQDLESYSQNEVIDRTQEILNLISSLCDRNIEEVEVDPNFTTIHELVPSYAQFTYKLKNYSQLDDSVVYSFSENLNGVYWRLKIYPHGNGKAKDKWLSVFLEMSQGYENDSKYEYKIELVNPLADSESVVREYNSKFDIGECWGYNEFIELEQLKNGFLEQDSLSFRFFVRNPDYKRLAVDQKRYTDKLEVRVKELERLVCDHNSSRLAGGGVVSERFSEPPGYSLSHNVEPEEFEVPKSIREAVDRLQRQRDLLKDSALVETVEERTNRPQKIHYDSEEYNQASPKEVGLRVWEQSDQ